MSWIVWVLCCNFATNQPFCIPIKIIYDQNFFQTSCWYHTASTIVPFFQEWWKIAETVPSTPYSLGKSSKKQIFYGQADPDFSGVKSISEHIES